MAKGGCFAQTHGHIRLHAKEREAERKKVIVTLLAEVSHAYGSMPSDV
jgi:hypothetical protein